MSTYTPIEIPMEVSTDSSPISTSLMSNNENVPMTLGAAIRSISAAEIYVDGSHLIINTVVPNGNEVNY